MLNWVAIRWTLLIFAVLAVVAGVLLMGVLGFGFTRAAATSAAISAAIVTTLILLQLWLNKRAMNAVPARIENHPELGRVQVHRSRWQADCQLPEARARFSVIGKGRTSGPTEVQSALWGRVRPRLASFVDSAAQALSDASNAFPKGLELPPCVDKFWLTHVWLESANEFALVLLYTVDFRNGIQAGRVVFRDGTVVEKRWLPVSNPPTGAAPTGGAHPRRD